MSGSPCCNPLAWQILLPAWPLCKILVLAVPRMTNIQFFQRQPKPMCWSASSRNVQDTVSKDFTMSILSCTHSERLACSALYKRRTALKLSWMQRPLMNALWLRLTSASSFVDKWFAKHLVINLLIL